MTSQSMKIRIDTESYSEAVQEKLFSLGYRWGSGKQRSDNILGGLVWTFFYAHENADIVYDTSTNGFGFHPYSEFVLYMGEFREVGEPFVVDTTGYLFRVIDGNLELNVKYNVPIEYLKATFSVAESPVGLRSRSVVNSIRIKEIADAIKRYTDVSKVIPQDWIDELSELNSMVV